MSEKDALEAALPGASDAELGPLAAQLKAAIEIMEETREEDTERHESARKEAARVATELSAVKSRLSDAEDLASYRNLLTDTRTPSKADIIGNGLPGHVTGSAKRPYQAGDLFSNIANLRSGDPDAYRASKAVLNSLGGYEESWGKAALGTTDATGGWIIPNSIVDDLIKPAQIDNIYRSICTVVSGVTAYAVDIPFRSAARNRAVIAAFGATKENVDLAYNGYTATMYTLARIHDVGNQFLRQSAGAAETDAIQELAAAFAQGEAYYVREGTGSSQPYGYTSALTSGPGAFRSTFSPSATTLAGSMASAIALAAGAVNARGVPATDLSGVLSASSYWIMLSQGTDSAGFFFAPAGGPNAIRANTLMSPFGIPIYPDADADVDGTAAVIDNLVIGSWKAFKLYFGASYRVDSSSVAGNRWDTNTTGFRGEEEMGFDARPAVYAGRFQMITDITP